MVRVDLWLHCGANLHAGHASVEVKDVVDNTANAFGIEDKLYGVVTDGAPNMVLARAQYGRNETCFLHITDLPLHEGLAEKRYEHVLEKLDFVVSLVHRSDKVVAALKQAQVAKSEKEPVTFPSPSQTRLVWC